MVGYTAIIKTKQSEELSIILICEMDGYEDEYHYVSDSYVGNERHDNEHIYKETEHEMFNVTPQHYRWLLLRLKLLQKF